MKKCFDDNYGWTLPYINDLGLWGVGAGTAGSVGADLLAGAARETAGEAIRNAPLAGVNVGGTILARQAANAVAARAASRIAIERAVLGGLAKLTGVIGAAATGWSAGAWIYCHELCQGEEP
jgi:hypothetical protein